MDGGTFSGFLTLIFIVLKLTGVITWSWWWVLSPLWISFGLAVVFILLALVGISLYTMASGRRENPAKALSRYGKSLRKK